MLRKTIKYTDYNGVEREDDFYFNLTRPEAIELEVSTKNKDGFSGLLKQIAQSEDRAEMVGVFKKIILLSYGVKSDDGKRFIKNDDVRDAFAQTEAYSELYMMFLTDAQAAADFINGILPNVPNAPTESTAPQDHLPKQAPALPSAQVVPDLPQTNGETDEMREFRIWKESQNPASS